MNGWGTEMRNALRSAPPALRAIAVCAAFLMFAAAAAALLVAAAIVVWSLLKVITG